MGWSDSEENDYKLNPSDFTVTDAIADAKSSQDHGFSSYAAVTEEQQQDENYFYTKIGFEVGTYFGGSKKIYNMRNK